MLFNYTRRLSPIFIKRKKTRIVPPVFFSHFYKDITTSFPQANKNQEWYHKFSSRIKNHQFSKEEKIAYIEDNHNSHIFHLRYEWIQVNLCVR